MGQVHAQSADTVYINGKIYTVNEAQPWAEAVAINNGIFEVVGTNDEAMAAVGDTTKIIDLDGAFVMPGLIDVHAHPLSVGIDRANLSFSDPTNVDTMLADLKAFAEANPDLQVIRGGSWNLGVFAGDSPTKDLLDAVVSDRPVYLVSQTGHSAWVNSKALENAGVTGETENTATIIFDRDNVTGDPSGTVREFAMGVILQSLPEVAIEPVAEAQAGIFAEWNSFGFTSIKAAEGHPVPVGAANILDRRGDLTMRIFASWDWRSHYMEQSAEKQAETIADWESYKSRLVAPNAVKMFFDGGPDSYTAFLLEDYEGRSGFRGQTNLPIEQFEAEVLDFNRKGLGVIVHVIGDAGGRELAKLFKRVREEMGPDGPLLHFSHAWMTRPEEFDVLADLEGVCMDFSPALAYPAAEIEGSMAPPVGDRYQTFFNVVDSIKAFQTARAIDMSIPIGFGSDWASALIPDPNGFHQMQAWVMRTDPENPSGPALNPTQAITLEEAIYGFTQGGAHCLGQGWEDKLGSLEARKLADFIVLDSNPFETPIENLWQTKIERTVVDGRVVYDRTLDIVDDLIDEETFNPGTRYTTEP
ncbi:amidohydrolase [Tropicibacter sp. Alg240-R139]|uniref:amidohydrolase n=1 Tax=Tropicibacter sp. Alg240-R139 TaxID=2305991 RepID=UPI0013DF179B|nr:amidohydrolase [Tropicibacter sp. Alg240-R139]